jgi:DNA polymerase/3'-5' exonuclease PolX
MDTKLTRGDEMMKQTKLEPENEVRTVEQLDLKSAGNIAEMVITQVDAWCEKIEVVGSIRRCRPFVHDIDFVVLPKEADSWNMLRNTVLTMMDTKPIFKQGDQVIRALLALESSEYVQIDFYRCNPANYGSIKLMRTGSAEHNIFLAKLAIKQGLRWLHTKGICKGEMVLAVTDEIGIFRMLNLEFIPPEEREMKDGKPVWDYRKYWRGYGT